MKVYFKVFFVFILSFFTFVSHAANLGFDNFELPGVQTGSIAGQGNVGGWAGTWQSTSSDQKIINISSTPISKTLSGGIVIDGGDQVLEISGNSSLIASREFQTPLSDNVYFAFLFQYAAGNISYNDFVTLCLNSAPGCTYSNIPAIGLKADVGPGSTDFMVRNRTSSAKYSPVQVQMGQSYYIVGHAFKSTGNAGDKYDRFELWVNPDFTDPTTESNPDIVDSSSSAISSVQYLGIRSAVLGAGDVVYIDGIAMSDSWEDMNPNTPPNIVFQDDVGSGSTLSETVQIKVEDINGDASSYKYGFSSDAICDASDIFSESFTSETSFNITDLTHNGDYICVQATDLSGSTSYALSAYPLNIQVILSSNDFVTTWRTTASGETITIPTTGAGYNYNLDCDNDGIFEQTGLTGNSTCNFAAAGDHTIRISGDFPRIYINNTGDKDKIISVNQWGNIGWRSFNRAFWGATNLDITATDIPNLSNVRDMFRAFRGCYNLEGNISMTLWDTKNIMSMGQTFMDARKFNQDISTKVVNSGQADEYIAWNTENVTNMGYMFRGAGEFDQNIGNWNTSKLRVMYGMFMDAKKFNQDISTKVVNSGQTDEYIAWNIENVTSLQYIFYRATAFNGNIENWNTSKVRNLYSAFRQARTFDRDVSQKEVNVGSLGNYTAWNTENVTNMGYTFMETDVFDGNIGNWNTSNVTNMRGMFYRSKLFNQDLETKVVNSGQVDEYIAWNTENVTNMSYIFRQNPVFNGNIDNWNTSKVRTLQQSFSVMNEFNRDISQKEVNVGSLGDYTAWNTAEVQTLNSTFYQARKFNQDIGNWNTSNVTNLTSTFYFAEKFNQDLNTKIINSGQVNEYTAWDVSRVTSLTSMFNRAYAFNQSLDSWDTSSVQDMRSAFYRANEFNQSLASWDLSGLQVLSATRKGQNNMLDYTNLSVENYDNTLIAWDAQNIPVDMILGARNLVYCKAVSERQNMIDSDGWDIVRDKKSCSPEDILLSSTSLDENTQFVGNLSTTDDDITDPNITESHSYAFVTGTGSEDNSLFQISATGALSFVAPPDYESPSDSGDTVGNNTYTIRIQTQDSDNNTFEKSFVITVLDVDDTPPTITITAPTKLSNSSITDTTFIVEDNMIIAPSGVSASGGTISCTQSGAMVLNCSATISSSGDLIISAQDNAGNSASETEANYVIDTIPPSVPNVDVDTSSGIDTPTVTFSATDNIAIDYYEVTYTNSGGVVVTEILSSPVNLELNSINLSAGETHSITVTAYDIAGNSTSNTVEFPPIINFTTPTQISNTTITDTSITIISPQGNDIENIGFTGAALGGNLPSFVCTGSGSDTSEPYASPVTCSGGNISSSGTLVVTAFDALTGARGKNQVSYIIDTVPPIITIRAPTKQSGTGVIDTSVVVTDDVMIDVSDISGTGGTLSCTQTNSTRVDCSVTILVSGDLDISVQDIAGNSVLSSETDYIIDSVPPTITITAPTKTSSGNITDTVIRIEDDVALSASDVSASGGNLSCTQLHTMIVECTSLISLSGDISITVVDSLGNSASETETNYIIDTLLPTITINSPTKEDNTPITDTTITITDNVGVSISDLTWTGGDLSCIQISPTQIDCTSIINSSGDLEISVKDSVGNITQEGESDYIIDTIPPVIVIQGDQPDYVRLGDTYTDAGATASDNVDGDITNNIIQDESEVDTSTLGTYFVNYEVEDSVGNVTTVQREVRVITGDVPILILNGENPQKVYKNEVYIESGSRATDTEDGDITSQIVLSGSVDTTQLGNYEIQYFVEDSNGNFQMITRTVEVIAGEAPEIQLIGSNPLNIYEFESYVEPGARATDGEDGDITHLMTLSGSVDSLVLGSYFIEYSVTDTQGNSVREIREVVVRKRGSSGGVQYDKCEGDDTSGSIYDGKCSKEKEKIKTPKQGEVSIEKERSEDEQKLEDQKDGNEEGQLFEETQAEASRLYTVENDFSHCPIVDFIQDPEFPYEVLGVFSDEDESVYKDTILKFAEIGIVDGYPDGTFRAKKDVSRVELVKMVLISHCYKYDGETTDNIQSFYSDMSRDSWQAQVVKKADNLGIISGYEDGTFRPNDAISRIEALKILLRMSMIQLLEDQDMSYTDIESSWQKRYISIGEALNLLYPKEENYIFSPDTGVSREDMINLIEEVMLLY